MKQCVLKRRVKHTGLVIIVRTCSMLEMSVSRTAESCEPLLFCCCSWERSSTSIIHAVYESAHHSECLMCQRQTRNRFASIKPFVRDKFIPSRRHLRFCIWLVCLWFFFRYIFVPPLIGALSFPPLPPPSLCSWIRDRVLPWVRDPVSFLRLCFLHAHSSANWIKCVNAMLTPTLTFMWMMEHGWRG